MPESVGRASNLLVPLGGATFDRNVSLSSMMTEGVSRQPKPSTLQEAIRRIVEVAHPKRVILFGSAARGTMGPGSDLDLLVIVSGPAHRGEVAGRIYQNMIGLGVPVDVIVATEDDVRIHHDDPGMIYEVALEEGRVVYGG